MSSDEEQSSQQRRPALQVKRSAREVFVQVGTVGPPRALIALEILDYDDEPLVQVYANGDIAYGKKYTPDVAARAFWSAMAAHFSRNIRLNRAT